MGTVMIRWSSWNSGTELSVCAFLTDRQTLWHVGWRVAELWLFEVFTLWPEKILSSSSADIFSFVSSTFLLKYCARDSKCSICTVRRPFGLLSWRSFSDSNWCRWNCWIRLSRRGWLWIWLPVLCLPRLSRQWRTWCFVAVNKNTSHIQIQTTFSTTEVFLAHTGAMKNVLYTIHSLSGHFL